MVDTAQAAREILEELAKTEKTLNQDIRVVFDNKIVTLTASAITVGPDRTSLYLSPADTARLASALQVERPARKPPARPNGKAADRPAAQASAD